MTSHFLNSVRNKIQKVAHFLNSVRNKIQVPEMSSPIMQSPYGDDGVSVGVSVGRGRCNYLILSISVGSVGAMFMGDTCVGVGVLDDSDFLYRKMKSSRRIAESFYVFV